jgi:hypothetical protein
MNIPQYKLGQFKYVTFKVDTSQNKRNPIGLIYIFTYVYCNLFNKIAKIL